MTTQKGFTLIELLVVIAIIGVLSAVVLASLNTARSKGDTAAILANLTSIRSQAELDFTTNGFYSNTSTFTSFSRGTCFPSAPVSNNIFADPVIINQIQSAKNSGTGLTACAVGTDKKSYAIAIQVKATSTAAYYAAYCMDSTGQPPTLKTMATNNQGGITNLIQSGGSSLCL
jgi:type IV pilus assembly protein PilA